MNALQWETAEEKNLKLAERIKNIRKRKSITQEMLSQQSGVSYGSIKRFETTGKISLLSFTKIIMALGYEQEIDILFTNTPYQNIQEVINENK